MKHWTDFKGISRNELILMVIKKQEMETGQDCSEDIKTYKDQIANKIIKRRDLIETLIGE